MRLTSFTDFGLRALMRMASDPDRGFSTAELADEFDLSRHHLAKIVQRLSQAGIVVTRRGAGGGVMLAKPASEIRLGDIVGWLEDDQAIVDCFMPGGGTCTIKTCCRLKARLRAAEAAFIDRLNASTLADIALPAPQTITG
ncbi:MAG: Rrf2 family transcriptional regulator [Alphaproteobacteria bacterium]|nr:Rrf2 family transcriptional regulator [Alphaproteobacteria bacterium]